MASNTYQNTETSEEKPVKTIDRDESNEAVDGCCCFPLVMCCLVNPLVNRLTEQTKFDQSKHSSEFAFHSIDSSQIIDNVRDDTHVEKEQKALQGKHSLLSTSKSTIYKDCHRAKISSTRILATDFANAENNKENGHQKAIVHIISHCDQVDPVPLWRTWFQPDTSRYRKRCTMML